MREINKRIAYTVPSTSHARIEYAMLIAESAVRTRVVIEEKTSLTIYRQECEDFNNDGSFSDLGNWD